MGADFRVLAEKHAREIIAIERWLHIDCELSLQKSVMKTDWLLIFFNKWVCYVAAQYTVLTISQDLRDGSHPRHHRLYGLLLPLL